MILLLGAVFAMVICVLPVQAEMLPQALLAEINGEAITGKDLERALGTRLV